MPESRIIAAARSVNQSGDLQAVKQLVTDAEAQGQHCLRLTIDSLRTPWQSPVEAGHFRSGCAPLEALAIAHRTLQNREADLVVIQGRDFLRTEYSQQERHEMMSIYPEMSMPEAYTLLARHFCDQEGISQSAFRQLRDAVFDNLKATAEEQGLKLPSDTWYQPLTDLFRGVDCANPVIDFEGIVVLTHPDNPLTALMEPVKIRGVGIGIARADGPEHARELAGYHALEKAIHYAEVQSGHSVTDIIRDPDMLLEAYTCYPVVPLALLIKGAALQQEDEILQLLKQKPITCTGGMNLARAPWNNPALNGLIALCDQLQSRKTTVLLHGNGGLGYKQGIALLSC